MLGSVTENPMLGDAASGDLEMVVVSPAHKGGAADESPVAMDAQRAAKQEAKLEWELKFGLRRSRVAGGGWWQEELVLGGHSRWLHRAG